MKKYRHKITGDIVKEYTNMCNHETVYTNGVHTIPVIFIENGNDWEEIKELPFKILKVISKKENDTYKKGTIITFLDTEEHFDKEWQKWWSIYSVLRISDSTEFKIGDKVNNPLLITPQPFIIKEFCSDYNNKHILALGGNGGINITKIEHYKISLFTTFDNVEIFEDCIVYGLFPDSWERFGQKCSTISSLSKLQYFSSVEALNNYVDENKPLYSKKNMISFGKQMFTRGVKNDYSCEAEVVLSMFKK